MLPKTQDLKRTILISGNRITIATAKILKGNQILLGTRQNSFWHSATELFCPHKGFMSNIEVPFLGQPSYFRLFRSQLKIIFIPEFRRTKCPLIKWKEIKDLNSLANRQ
jgi:hypothetical protein